MKSCYSEDDILIPRLHRAALDSVIETNKTINFAGKYDVSMRSGQSIELVVSVIVDNLQFIINIINYIIYFTLSNARRFYFV